ncbi:MAG: PHP domain-containing protein [Clostridia bacterium]|nr:PHP domain-containing protein [Clostridia bacterium]
MIIDLHNHTMFSYDSSDTPEEVIENAIRHNVDVVGICDHQFSIGNKLDEYYMYLQHCKVKYSNDIRVLCGLEIGTRPKPDDLIADAASCFDYVLFESLDAPRGAMDFYEFLEWRKLFKCKVGLAHTDIFKLGEKYGLNIIEELKKADIFWEINTSGNYNYYYDFLTNEKKRQLISDSGIEISIGSDTHWVGQYRFKQIKRANELVEILGNPLP